MSNHEYALLGGLNRAKVGRYLGTMAASVSAFIVFIMLSFSDIAKSLGLPTNLTPSLMSLIGAGAVFGVLYWIFNRYAWRWPLLNLAVKVPNLSGDWNCEGSTCNTDGSSSYQWNATVTIYQSWDKIRVKLKLSNRVLIVSQPLWSAMMMTVIAFFITIEIIRGLMQSSLSLILALAILFFQKI